MTKSELKQLIKEVLVEQNALTTLQISTVGGGTTLLLYKGDARGSELSSDKHYKTPTKFKDLIASLNTTGGMTSDESIKKILKKLTPAQLKELVREKIVVSDKVSDALGEMSVNENYEDNIKDTKDRMAYLALRKQEKDYISKSKQSSSPIKKQHYMDMSKQVLDKAHDILKKHKVVDEANTKELQKLGFTPTKSDVNEVKGYVLGPMDQASSWIAWNKKPKNKNGKKMWVVSAAEFQKQFPSIQMKELPAKPSYGADYYIIDSEGDLFPYSQANIGSGLD